jgi:hypothetical protein
MASLASALMAGILFAVVPSYFDAHNHITGILPYQAYANLPAFIATFTNPREQVNYDDRLALYRYLADVWYPSKQASLDDKLFSPADIVKEYEYAASLIAYWNRSDPAFRMRSGQTDRQSLLRNVRRHLENMASDTAPAY